MTQVTNKEEVARLIAKMIEDRLDKLVAEQHQWLVLDRPKAKGRATTQAWTVSGTPSTGTGIPF